MNDIEKPELRYAVNGRVSRKEVPLLLILLACAYVISAIAVSNILGWNLIVRTIAGVYVIVHLLFLLARRIQIVKPNAVHLIFLTWSLLGIVGGYDTVHFVTLLSKLWTVLQLIIVTYFLYALAIEAKSIRWLEWGYLFGVLVSSLWVFVESGGQFGIERIAGTQENANLFAFVLIIGCTISLNLLLQYRSIFIKCMLLCNAAILFLFILATGSRKGVIGFFILLFIYSIASVLSTVQGRRIRSLVYAGVGIALAIMVAFPMVVSSPHWGRFKNLKRYAEGRRLIVQERSLSDRMSLYSKGFELTMQNPFFGVGLDQFRYYNRNLRLTNYSHTYAHSNVIEVLADTGIIGFFIYYSAYALIAIRIMLRRREPIYNLSRNYKLYAMSLGAIILLYDLFSVTYYSKEYWLCLAILIYLSEIPKHLNGKSDARQTHLV